ncbi:MAG: glycosyltransferase, partial [Lautropia sp.]
MASSTTPLTLHFVVPGDLATATGGYAYARELLAAWRRAGREVVVHPLPDGFPLPSPDDRAAAAATFAALPDGATVIVDGLAFGALPALAACHGRRLKLIALVHHPLALETGLAPPLAARLRDDERQALAQARAVIVTSATTAATLAADYAVAPERITIVEPGVRIAATARDRHRPWQESAPTDQSAGHGAAVAGKAIDLLCVATLTPRKGHPVLFDALASIDPALRWRLLCIGSATRDPGHAARLRAQCEARGLCDRGTLAGAVDAATLERAGCGA